MKFFNKYMHNFFPQVRHVRQSRLRINERNCSHAHDVLPEKSLLKKQMRYGQPTWETHKHLLQFGELLPGLSLEEFQIRREKLVQNIISSSPKSSHVILVPSATTIYMTEKIPYVFRQNSDFLYLTGCLEPDSILMLIISPNESFESTIFVREKTEHSELWEGPRTGVANAVSLFGVDNAKAIESLHLDLLNIRKKLGKFCFWYDFTSSNNSSMHKIISSFVTSQSLKDMQPLKNKIHELRAIKSPSEQKLLRESAAIASRSIEKAMGITKPGITEHQLFATVDYFSRMNGAEFLAYPPVVASGSNANIIHYINNNQQIEEGDLILMDAGCELHGYCSDITRTWPSNGVFNDVQKTLYEIVLYSQLELIQTCSGRPMNLDKLFNKMCLLLGQRLKEAHILTKLAESMNLNEVAFKLCPHHVSHYLGMDVHDTASLSKKLPFQEGMVITVEPGLYIKSGSDLTRPEFHNLGIRIEDDVLITNSGIEVLSTASKDPSQIENIIQSSINNKNDDFQV